MSIASEIQRLQGVKSDILGAIADKGVTVPSGSMLDDCPGLIEGISGGGGDATLCSSIFFSQEESLNLPQTLEKANLCIIFSFVTISAITMLTLYNGSNANGYVNVGSNQSLRVNNQTASFSNEVAINYSNQSVIIREAEYKRFEGDSTLSNWCPYQNNNIDKININGTIKRIAFYYGAINDFWKENKIIDLRPCIEEGQQGFKDVVSGNFYPLNNCMVSP